MKQYYRSRLAAQRILDTSPNASSWSALIVLSQCVMKLWVLLLMSWKYGSGAAHVYGKKSDEAKVRQAIVDIYCRRPSLAILDISPSAAAEAAFFFSSATNRHYRQYLS